MSKKNFFKGTFLLTSAGLFSRIMGFFYRIFLSYTIGAEGIGRYQLAVPIQQLVIAMTTSGIQTALSRLISSHFALGEEKKAHNIFCIGTILAVSLSLAASWLLFTFSDFFAAQILKAPDISSLIRLLSFSFPFAAIHSCTNSYYLGQKKAAFPAGTQLLEQSVRIFSSFIIYQICISKNLAVTASIAAAGAFLSEFAAALFSLIFLSLSFHSHRYSFLTLDAPLKNLSEINSIAFPLTLNRILLSVLSGMEVILIPQRLCMYGLDQSNALTLYGIFTGMALPFILFPSTIASSASVMLTPSVAEMQALGHQNRLTYITKRTTSVCIILGSLCTAIFYFLGSSAGVLLFHNADAGIYIKTLSFICPFLYTNISLTSILNGLGQTKRTLIHSISGVCLRIFFVLFAIPTVGIRGYLYGILLSEILLSILHIYALYRINS